jgi:hypothetical protein
MIDLLGDLNWLAVLVATLAWYIFSAIYYAGPVLGKTWQAANNLTLPEGYRPPPRIFIITFVAYFAAAITIGLLVLALGISTVGDAIELGLVLSIGLAVMGLVIDSTYAQKSWSLVWINGLNVIIAWSGMAVILALWD